jgi:hypothetical protein
MMDSCFTMGPGSHFKIYTLRSSINGYFARYLRCSKILILKIRECIPAVKILERLDLKRTVLFMDGHYLDVNFLE